MGTVEKFVSRAGWTVDGAGKDWTANCVIWVLTASAMPELAGTIKRRDNGRPPELYIHTKSERLPSGWREQVAKFLEAHDPDRSAQRNATANSSVPYIFVSYSRDDQAYVNKLVSHLKKSAVTCWIDKSGIDYGDRWEKEIVTNLDACSVFVVIMTPSSEHSDWVIREIARAEKKGKPILPLLLDGDVFFRLSDRQYESVVGGKMPPKPWVDKVAGLLADG